MLVDSGTDSKLTKKQLELKRPLSYSSYCRACEFTDWCNKKNKPFALQTTIEAKELHNEIEKGDNGLIFDELPEKIYQLSVIAGRTLIDVSRER